MPKDRCSAYALYNTTSPSVRRIEGLSTTVWDLHALFEIAVDIKQAPVITISLCAGEALMLAEDSPVRFPEISRLWIIELLLPRLIESLEPVNMSVGAI
jgi:hypothetical protein